MLRFGESNRSSVYWRDLSAGVNYGKALKSRRLTRSVVWSWREESNLQPAVYKTAALPIELRQLKKFQP